MLSTRIVQDIDFPLARGRIKFSSNGRNPMDVNLFKPTVLRLDQTGAPEAYPTIPVRFLLVCITFLGGSKVTDALSTIVSHKFWLFPYFRQQ
jgi:hypothetical protein